MSALSAFLVEEKYPSSKSCVQSSPLVDGRLPVLLHVMDSV